MVITNNMVIDFTFIDTLIVICVRIILIPVAINKRCSDCLKEKIKKIQNTKHNKIVYSPRWYNALIIIISQ